MAESLAVLLSGNRPIGLTGKRIKSVAGEPASVSPACRAWGVLGAWRARGRVRHVLSGIFGWLFLLLLLATGALQGFLAAYFSFVGSWLGLLLLLGSVGWKQQPRGDRSRAGDGSVLVLK